MMNTQLANRLTALVNQIPRSRGRRSRKAGAVPFCRYSYRPRIEALEDRLTPSSVSGEAFGAFVNLTSPVAVSVPKTPDVVLPPNGGMAEDEVAGISQPGVISTAVLEVSTEGSIGPHSAFAESHAAVDSLNLLNGLITADIVVAMSTSVSDGKTATSSAAGSGFLNLTVNGVSESANVPANTSIALPGVGTVILNEQIFAGDGKHSTSLTVNMIDVKLNGSLGTGQIIVSSAHSDVNFTNPGLKQGNVFMTGGGRLGSSPSDFATFGFNAGMRNGAPEGQVQYTDHGQGIDLHSTAITSFSVDPNNPNCVIFTGTARVNGVDGYTFRVRACDNAEPGAGRDTFEITINGPGGFTYSSVTRFGSNTITAGNIQEHFA
jgi:hypothetical protein